MFGLVILNNIDIQWVLKHPCTNIMKEFLNAIHSTSLMALHNFTEIYKT